MRLPGLSLFTPKKPKLQPQVQQAFAQPLPPVPTPQTVSESTAEQDRKEEEAKTRKRRSGLAATRLTSGLGDEDETTRQRSTLGGA